VIWQHPWAWVGLLAIAAPILLHLLGLGRSPRQRFPTLRFFDASRLAPTRRTQLHDPWLLLLRMAVFVAAVAALAQPFYRSAERERAFAASLARVVVLDTSASVQHGGALDSSRRLAASLVAAANVGQVLETAQPTLALDGAIAWLGLQPQRRELVVLSDFQLGALDSLVLRRVPADIGVRLERIAAGSLQFPVVSEHLVGSRTVRAVTTRTDSGATRIVQVEWTSRALVDSAERLSVRVLASDAERESVRAALDASLAIGARLVSLQDSALMSDSAPEMLIVTPGSPQRRALLATARAPGDPWMLQVIAALRSDVVLQESARSDVSGRDSAAGLVVAYTADEWPAVWAVEAEFEGRVTLVLVTNTGAESLTMPALLAAARAVSSPQPDVAELETARFSDRVLASLYREPATELQRSAFAGSPNAVEGESDGRWLWLLVLLLLGAEALFRRRVHAQRTPSVVT